MDGLSPARYCIRSTQSLKRMWDSGACTTLYQQNARWFWYFYQAQATITSRQQWFATGKNMGMQLSGQIFGTFRLMKSRLKMWSTKPAAFIDHHFSYHHRWEKNIGGISVKHPSPMKQISFMPPGWSHDAWQQNFTKKGAERTSWTDLLLSGWQRLQDGIVKTQPKSACSLINNARMNADGIP